jgi:L-alanine-DL-glutamate epimerase-like enolase superfamily enzyme
LVAAIPQESLPEFCVSRSPLKRDLLLGPFRIEKDGFVGVLEKPGLGIELNEEIVEKFSK